MATLEQVCTELYNLNGLNDLQLETQLEIHQGIGEMSDALGETNQHLIDIKKVLDSFVNAVPEQIIGGFEKIIVQDRLADQKQEQTKEKLKSREEGDAPKGIRGAFARGKMDADPSKDFKKMFSGFTSAIEDSLETLGRITAISTMFGGKIKQWGKWALSMLGMAFNTLLAGLSGLVSAILSPIGLIAAAIVAAAMGIYNAVQGFMNFEGDILDKLIEGVQNFIDGCLLIVTKPLDWILQATAWLLDAIGFDSVAEVLRGFSFTDLVDDITDGIANMLMSIKDWIVEKVMGLAGPVLRFLGFDEAALSAEVTADAYKNKDNDKLREEADKRSEEQNEALARKIGFGSDDAPSAAEEEKEKQGREAADEAIQRVAQIQEEAQADTKRIRQDAKTQAESARVSHGQTVKVPTGTPPAGVEAQPQVIGPAPVVMGSGDNNMTVNEAGPTYSRKDLTFVSTNNTRVRVPAPRSRGMSTREVLEERATDRIDRMVTGYETDAATKITTMINEKSPIKVSQGDVASVLSSVTNSEGGFLESTVNKTGSFISSIFGGDQSTANANSEMMARTEQLNDNRATANTTNGGSVAVVDNSSSSNTTVNNMSLSGTPTTIDRSDRTHIGSKFGRGGQ